MILLTVRARTDSKKDHMTYDEALPTQVRDLSYLTCDTEAKNELLRTETESLPFSIFQPRLAPSAMLCPAVSTTS